MMTRRCWSGVHNIFCVIFIFTPSNHLSLLLEGLNVIMFCFDQKGCVKQISRSKFILTEDERGEFKTQWSVSFTDDGIAHRHFMFVPMSQPSLLFEEANETKCLF